MNRKPIYRFSCANAPDLSVLRFIIEHARPIKRRAFTRNVDSLSRQNVECDLGYSTPAFPKDGLRMSDDYHVGYHRSRLPDGRPVYYLVWSAFEFVFCGDRGGEA